MEKLRVILAEDHAVIREGLKLLVNNQPDMEVVGEAGDGALTCKLVRELHPHVVVMDISMPDMSGSQATRELLQSDPQVKVLALTVHEERGYLREMLQAGAVGYVLKRAAADDLISAIRTVAEGQVYMDPVLAGKVVSSFILGSKPEGSPRENTLSQREREVLCMIAQGYSNKEIATTLDISTKTVETYKYRGMEKLALTTRADIVRYVLQRGWLNKA